MKHTRRRSVAALAGGLALAAVAAPLQSATAAVAPAHNEQVALVDGSGKQVAAKSHINGTAAVASANGRYVVFSTDAALVPADTNGVDDVYRRDTETGRTLLVSKRGARIGNDYSFEPTISSSGRYVAWTTWATNLAKDTNGSTLDILVKDLKTNQISRVSVDSKERQTQRNSFSPVISGNGRFVSFQTFGSFGKKDQDSKEDVYVRDVRKGTTKQASLAPVTNKDIPGPMLNGDISDDGTKVVFGKNHKLWVRDMAAGKTKLFHSEPKAAPCQPDPIGSAGRPAISGNGRYAAISSCAAALPGETGEFTDIYRIDLTTGATVRVHPQGNGHSYLPSLSRDGRYVGFGSDAGLVASDDEGQPDAYVADVQAGTVVRASQTPAGVGGSQKSAANAVSISANGQALVYQSYADNLVPGDKFDLEESFLWRAAS